MWAICGLGHTVGMEDVGCDQGALVSFGRASEASLAPSQETGTLSSQMGAPVEPEHRAAVFPGSRPRR
jgi:hypothetical protein